MYKKGKYLLSGIIVFLALLISVCVPAEDKTNEVVRVAFFPMEGYNYYDKISGKPAGLDVEYLEKLSQKTDWQIEYVDCESWDKALEMLENKQVDLVGSAQYSVERAEKFDYANFSSGYTFGAIAVNNESPVAYEDFGVMREITFGFVKSYVRKDDFYQYMSEHGVLEPKVIEYETTSQMQDALDNGEINAIVHTFMELHDGQRVIGRFADSQYYYMTYKGNTHLMNQLNSAIIELKSEKPELESNLINKYYGERLNGRIVLTMNEKKYVSEKRVFNVGYIDGYYPFSYELDGEYKGLSRSIFDNMSAITGAKIRHKKVEDIRTGVTQLEAGHLDMLCYYVDENTKRFNALMPEEYVSVPMAFVVRKGNENDKINTVAITAGAKLVIDKQELSDYKLLEYDDENQCIRAVVDGGVDAAICSSYLGSFYLNAGEDSIEMKSVMPSEEKIGIAVSDDADKRLVSIVKKISSTFSNQQINEFMLVNTVSEPFSLKLFFAKHKSEIAIILMLIVLVVLVVILRMMLDARKIQRLMYKDAELGIWNLNYFIFWARKRLELLPKNKYAIVYINSAQFKIYGTLYGWRESNKMLKAMSDVLENSIIYKGEMYARGKSNNNNNANNEIYARSQGDRFVLMLTWKDKQVFLIRLKELIEKLEIELKNVSGIHNTINVGVRFIEAENEDIMSSINMANQALDSISEKKTGISGIQVFDDELSKAIFEQHLKEEQLESADINKDFVTYYQAKVDITSNKIVGAEALIRYINPNNSGKITSPSYFVPYYERTGKIKEIDFFVLESVCKMLRRRLDERKNVVTVSCNFSRRHFAEEGFSAKLVGVIEKYKIPKDLIEIEITETIIMEELQQQRIYQTMAELHACDIQLSIDDFGSGYSSLGVFERVPAAVLKLDRSFLTNHVDRERQIVIMRQIVSLAEGLNAKVVCEGVETEEDVALMSEIGASIAQGFKYAKPEPEKSFENKLDKQA